MKKLLFSTLALTILCGCTGYGNITKNLSKDAAIVRIDINSPWGKQTFVRVGAPTNSVSVSADGSIITNPGKK